MALTESGIIGDFPYAIWDHVEVGYLCGYLGVPPPHPWYGKDYDDVDIDIHGGLSFGQSSIFGHPAMVALLEGRLIDHSLPSLDAYYERRLEFERQHVGEDRNFPIDTTLDIWWLGFDCGHYRDGHSDAWVQMMNQKVPTLDWHDFPGDVYRDRDYVYHELEGLASQAAMAVGVCIEEGE